MTIFIQGDTVLKENEEIKYFGIIYEGTCAAYDSN